MFESSRNTPDKPYIEKTATDYPGGRGGGPMDPMSWKDYTDARIGEVRSDIKVDIVTLESRIDERLSSITTKLDRLPTRWQFISTFGGGILAIFAILAYAADRSDSAAERAATIAGALARLEAAATIPPEEAKAAQAVATPSSTAVPK